MQVQPVQWTSAGCDDAKVEQGAPKAGTWDAVAFAFSIAVVGVFYGWQEALSEGFGLFLCCYFVIAFGFTCMVLCLAEMSSFFPFGGGSFGYARCILSPQMGFLVGAMELLEYLLFVVTGIYTMGGFCSTLFGTSPDLEPVWWIVFFAVSLPTQVCGGRTLWCTMRGLAAVTGLLCAAYAVIMLTSVALASAEDAPAARALEPPMSATRWLRVVPAPCWMFFCVEAVALMADDVERPKQTVPRATVTSWVLLLAAITICMAAATVAFPGADALAAAPTAFGPGLSHVTGLSARLTLVAILPATVASLYGLLYAVGKLVASMAASGVLPRALGRVCGRHRSPVAGLSAIAAAALGLLFLLRHLGAHHAGVALRACMLCACFVYVALAASFWVCRRRYSNLVRHFCSPLGAVGAVGCGAVFLLVFAALALDTDGPRALVIFACALVGAALYYRLSARRWETFSAGEVDIFVTAYVINANLRRKRVIRQRSRKRIDAHKAAARPLAPRAAAVAPSPPGPTPLPGLEPEACEAREACPSTPPTQGTQARAGAGPPARRQADSLRSVQSSGRYSRGSIYLGP